MDLFVQTFGDFVNEKSEQKIITIKDEVLGFETLCKGFNGSFSDFWRQNHSSMPKLTSLVVSTSIIQASSVPVESTFSVSGYVQRKERHNLSSKNLRFTMLARETNKVKEIFNSY